MSGDTTNLLVLVGIIALIIYYVTKSPSDKERERQRKAAEHEVELKRIQAEKEQIEARIKAQKASSGRGKIVKAKWR